jgi:hypothetical protein
VPVKPERDPRVDPKPGDVLLIGPQWQSERYEVISSMCGVVCYILGDSRQACLLREWREWAKGAQVIRKAEGVAND